MAQYMLQEMKYDNDTINKVITLIQYHDCTLASKLSIKRMLNKIGEKLLRDLIKVQRSDILAQNPVYSEERLTTLISSESKLDMILDQNECFSLKDLKVNGEDLINIGFNKGKDIGVTLKYLLERVIENTELNSKEELIKLAKEKLNS